MTLYCAPHIFYRAGLPIVFNWLLLLLAFFIPISDAKTPPFFDLSLSNMDLIYFISESGKYGVPIVLILVLTVLVSRNNIDRSQRIKESILVVLIGGVLAGGGSIINEHLIKAELQVPRPNIVWLAGEGGQGPLGMSVDAFYAVGSKQARSTVLADVLSQRSNHVQLTSLIKAHWVDETGFSLPSGHAFSAMFFATFLLMLGATYLTTKRLCLLYFLLPWALAVCYSRPLLGVHTPIDVLLGGLQGVVIGLLGWFICINVLNRASKD